MKKRVFCFAIALWILLGILPARQAAGESGAPETHHALERESTVYAGEIFVDGISQVRYLFSQNITITKSVFSNLKSALNGTVFYDIVPGISSESTAVNGFFRYTKGQDYDMVYSSDSNFFGGISHDWSSAATVAGSYIPGTPGKETNVNMYDHQASYKNYVDSSWPQNDIIDPPLTFNKRFLSELSVSSKIERDENGIPHVVSTEKDEATAVIYTSVHISTKQQSAEPTEKVAFSKLKKVKLKALSAKKLQVTWKKLSKKDQKKIQKIEIQYSTDKAFKTYKTKWVKKTKSSVKIGGLKKNTKYWVRIRAYKKDGNIIYVSKWVTKGKKTRKK